MLNNSSLDKLKIKRNFFISIKEKPLIGTLLLFIFTTLVIILTLTVGVVKQEVSVRAKGIYLSVIQLTLTGIALGISSYILQRISRNRFADVTIMGVGTINLLFLCFILLGVKFSNHDDTNRLTDIEPWVFIGVSGLLMIIYFFVSRQKESFNYKKLIIGGIIFTFFVIALAQSIRGWLSYHASEYIKGYISGSSTRKPINTIIIAGVFITLVLMWILVNSYKLQLITVNQQIAKQLGVNINFQVFSAMLCIGIMVGASYALSGDFVYVGLLAGNLALRKRKNYFFVGVINAALYGVISVLITFFIAISLLQMKTNHVGAILPLFIGPYFIYRIIKN